MLHVVFLGKIRPDQRDMFEEHLTSTRDSRERAVQALEHCWSISRDGDVMGVHAYSDSNELVRHLQEDASGWREFVDVERCLVSGDPCLTAAKALQPMNPQYLSPVRGVTSLLGH